MNLVVVTMSFLSLAVFGLFLVVRVLTLELGVVDRPIKVNNMHHYQPQTAEMMLALFCLSGLVVVHYFQIDFMLADWIYAQTHWVLKKSFIANDILHKSAKVILIAVYLYLLIKLVMTAIKSGKTQKVYDLAILLLSIGLSVAIVSMLKRMLDVDCPWDLFIYGGDKPFFPLFNYSTAYLPSANCFPSSHASVGFSWIAVYFYFSVNNNPLKYKALLAALLMGLIFGITQQLRGAHFISHDLTSLLICLTTVATVYSLAYRKARSKQSA